MGIPASDKGGGAEFKPAPAGLNIAVCVGVIDLGTRETSFQGDDPYKRREVLLQWELVGLDAEERRDDGKPWIVSKTYTLSLSQKANLRKDLESWRGRPFTADELKAFELLDLEGIPGHLNIVHVKSKDGQKTYANVAGLAPLKKNQKFTHPTTNSLTFEFTNKDGELLDNRALDHQLEGMPEWIASKIRESDEYQDSLRGLTGRVPTGAAVADDDDEIPF
jgi:hypothetical protein